MRAAVLVAVLLVGCAPTIKRDLRHVPAGQVGFDDLCGLQDYFDRIELGLEKGPTLLRSTEFEGKRTSGRSRFVFEGEFQLQHARRVLEENWRKLPPDLATATRLEVEAKWSQRAGVARAVMDADAELAIGKRSWPLPYHPCLSEWLFGAPLYKQRRELGNGATAP
jgi:hypothetical protein